MARRAGRWDRGKSGIPSEVADNGAGAACGERRWAVPAKFVARAPREGEREKMIGVSRR
jgi:hypothetical protein